jgi:8-oxo-dGTP diphosphatase
VPNGVSAYTVDLGRSAADADRWAAVINVTVLIRTRYPRSGKDSPKELCDVYDHSGIRTGRTFTRGTELPPGNLYMVVQVWIQNEAGEYLIQQRALHLTSGPGMWATTAGAVVAGEESRDAAIREVQEELGVQLLPVHFTRRDQLIMNDRIEEIWFATVPRTDIGKPTPGPEVSHWLWVSRVELKQMIDQGDFFRYSYIDDLLTEHDSF